MTLAQEIQELLKLIPLVTPGPFLCRLWGKNIAHLEERKTFGIYDFLPFQSWCTFALLLIIRFKQSPATIQSA